MKLERRIGLWWVPLLLLLAPALRLAPAHRDLIDFFGPMRMFTATSLGAGTMPWLNLSNGCGEAWFANPETGVLYPPAWLHLILPLPWALTAEIAFHLAWLSLGVGLLARSLGAGSTGRSVSEVAAWSIGPVIFTVGVLNNLETLAWVPWMVLAARLNGRRAVPLLALTCAMAWLGGEPQIWAMAVVLAFGLAQSRQRAAVGLALGAAVVSVQMAPFVYWILEGDRGPQAAEWALRGALAPADWLGILLPALPADPDRMVYVESLFFGAPLLVWALLGAARHRWLLVVVAVLGLLATLPEIGGGSLFLALTGGLVRYPSRFAVAGLVLLLPFVGLGAERWMKGRGRWLAVACSGVVLVLCVARPQATSWLVAGVPAGLLLVASLLPPRRDLHLAALGAAVVGVAIAAWPLLGLQPIDRLVDRGDIWPETGDGGRVYTPTPSVDDMRWFTADVSSRRIWPVGYLNLLDGMKLVRTDSPVAQGDLMNHLRITAEGPHRRWWLDTLAARWVILPESAGIPDDMEPVRTTSGLQLFRNRGALPEVLVASNPPAGEEYPSGVGRVLSLQMAGNRFRSAVETEQSSWLWVSLAPVRGWRWRLDGVEVELEEYRGIVQFLRVPEGQHRLEGMYRPPALLPAGLVSVGAILSVLFMLATTARDLRSGAPDTLE